MVSVVIPIYNQGKYLKDCVMSVLNQDYDDYEILICDDGSTDDTKDIVYDLMKKYKGKIRYFSLSHTGSPAVPRNVGMRKAKGKYVAFLDADDLMEKTRIERQVNFLERNLQIDVLCTNALMFNDNSKKTELYFKDLKEGLISLKQLFNANYVIQSTILMKREVIGTVGYNYEKAKFYHEDFEYWLRALSLNKKIYYLPEPLIRYRINPAGISHTLFQLAHIKKSLNTFNILYKNLNISDEARRIVNNKIKEHKRKLFMLGFEKFKPVYTLLRDFGFRALFPIIYFVKLLKFNLFTKHQSNIKLHLGCGQEYLQDYVNIDYPPSFHTVQSQFKKVDFYYDITKLKLKRNSIDEIRLHHVLEHFTYPQSLKLLIQWQHALKPNGKLIVETPDFKATVQELFKQKTFQQQAPMVRHIFGSHEATWAVHRDGWFKEKYEYILPRLGYKIIKIKYSQYKCTRNITVTAKKATNLLDIELQNRLKKILNLYLIDNSETKLLKEWLSIAKLK